MSPDQSPHSSSGHGPASSPFAGTDPTLYSPELARNARPGHRRKVTVVVAGKEPATEPNILGKYPNMKSNLPLAEHYVEGAFVNELAEEDPNFISRYQFITQLPDGTNAGMESEQELFRVQNQMKLYACFHNAVPYYNRGVFIRYDNLQDAAEGKAILEQHGFALDYTTAYDYALAKSQDTTCIKEFEGQIKISIYVEPNPDHAIWEFGNEDLAGITKAVEITAGAFGAVRNVVHVDTLDEKMLLVFRVEFQSVDAGNRAVESLNIDAVWGMNQDKTYQWCTVEPAHWSGERATNSPHRYKPHVDSVGRFQQYRLAPNTIEVAQPWGAGNRRGYRHPHDQHNRVRRERILDGSDVRTTVMLRNIPNKLDWMALKTILDNVSFGTYDFIYLRIDFKSGCNVGYAFINFADASGMLALIDRIERRLWPGFNSDKTAEISYATIQGREALVQKFRNSSVMQETPYCRPRLVYTLVDADAMGQLRIAGTEQAFPRPDNLSKLQRSMDSARSVGLYPPHGYSNLNEHRGRATAYDRGGPRDILQAAVHYARQRAAPVPFAGLTDAQKKDIENWYSETYGGGHCGLIPFDCIPMTHVAQYFAEVSGPMAAPGVIGGPVGSPFSSGFASIPDGTPTRGSRVLPHPLPRRCGVEANSPFT